MKKIPSYIKMTLAFMLLTVGCKEDFLERKPLGRYTTETYPAGGLSEYVYGMYAELRTWGVHAFAYVGITSITSDDADKGSSPADGPDQKALDEFTVLPNNGLINDFYKGHFAAINKCNVVLQQSDLFKTTISESDYFLSRAEARFIRGYLYFNLVRTFGGVPKVETVLTEEGTFNIGRATKEEIYALVEEDLKFASQYLPVQWEANYIGRPTKGSAEGVLAKVYLYQQKWGASLAAAQAVIGTGVYNLTNPYTVIFTEKGENTSESVFEIQNLYNKTYQFGSQYAEVQGLRAPGSLNLGWGFNTPSQQLVDAYESGDPRKDATILFKGETTPYGEVIPTTLDNERYNQKVYTNPSNRIEANAQNGMWVNIRILRYADVLLMAAEAANELGQTDVALANLELVRARARGSNGAILPKIVERDQALLRNLIRHERRIELAMEQERFFDLVRWGIADEVLDAAGKPGFTKGRNELMPIPQSEIDKSNGKLIQNPGY